MPISAKSPQSSSKTALSIRGLTYLVHGTSILDNGALDIQAGEFISIFGPNGGGKTTLLNLIMGFLKPTKGTISLFGQSPQEARHLIGYLPQSFRPDPLFPISVYDVVALGNSDPIAALKTVNMEGFAKASFGTLSGGEASRVLLARALAGHPQLLLLDEPIASVDPVAKKTIYRLLNQIKGSVTVIMVTHDLDGAVALSDRLYCVNQTISEYSKEALCHHFAHGLYHGNPS